MRMMTILIGMIFLFHYHAALSREDPGLIDAQHHANDAITQSVQVIEFPKKLIEQRQALLTESLTRLESVVQSILVYFSGTDPSGCGAFSSEEVDIYKELASILKGINQSKTQQLSSKTVQTLWSKLYLLFPQLARVSDWSNISSLISWYANSCSRCQCMRTVTKRYEYWYAPDPEGGTKLVKELIVTIEDITKCKKGVNVITCTIVGNRCCITPGLNCSFP